MVRPAGSKPPASRTDIFSPAKAAGVSSRTQIRARIPMPQCSRGVFRAYCAPVSFIKLDFDLIVGRFQEGPGLARALRGDAQIEKPLPGNTEVPALGRLRLEVEALLRGKMKRGRRGRRRRRHDRGPQLDGARGRG